MFDLTPVFTFGAWLLFAAVTAFVIPWIKSKTTAQQQATLAAVVNTLVNAAEQLYRSEQIQDRLAYVVEQLEERGLTVDIAEIEAAVKRLNQNEVVMGLPIETEGVIETE